MFAPEALLIIIIIAAGLSSALEAAQSPTACLDAARDLSRTLRPSDLLVADWDHVSLLYSAFWGGDARRFDVPAIANVSGAKTVQLLDREVARVMSSGGRAYFLGVLDMPEGAWKLFLGSRCHLPYHSLDRMRRCAKPVVKLACSEGDEVLWQLSFHCYNR